MEIKKTVVQIQNPNLYLFNLVSSCLLKEFRFYDSSEERRDLLIKALEKVADTDPEFVLQLAYYLRNQLYIRTTTNFILAFASIDEKTAPFLQKYFNKSVLLPSDFLDVCQWSQIIYYLKKHKFDFEKLAELKTHDFRKKFRFKKVLITVLKEKFTTFNLFQLGKYCSESRRKKILNGYQDVLKPERVTQRKEKLQKKNQEKAKFEEKQEEQFVEVGARGGRGGKLGKMLSKKNKFMKKHGGNKSGPKTMLEIPFITMKDVIRIAHIKNPQFLVRSVLGKRYPENELVFQQAFQGEDVKFDPTQATKRMKIDTPKTWETELSSKGNKSEVWAKLVSSNQLPYMAMMRNLRNLLKVGLNDHLHAEIIARIRNEKAIQNAKMFPFQYFSALSEIDALKEKDLVQIGEKMVEVDELPANIVEEVKEEEKEVKIEKKPSEKYTIDSLIEDYKDSIKKAIEISVDKNLEKITGRTLIFSDVSGSMSCPMSGGKKYGSVRECTEVALLLGLMIKSKCEESSFFIFSSPGPEHKDCYLEVKLNSKDILEDMKTLKKEAEKLGGGTDFPFKCIRELIDKKIKVDNMVILSDMMISQGYSEMDKEQQSTSNLLNEYRNQVNSNLKIFSIDLKGYSKVLNLSDEFNEQNYVRIFGMSDGVLKFISAKEKGTQVDEIKKFAANIDVQGN